MVRWGQVPLSAEALRTAMTVFRPDLYTAALGQDDKLSEPSGAIGAFAGPAFDAGDIEGHLRAFAIGRWKPKA
jgi:NitT/TauT family transport system ATP-binding protein